MGELSRNNEAAADLVELNREVDDLESARTSLVGRLEQARAGLVAAGRRAASLRASIQMVRDQIASNALTAANLRALRDEVRSLDGSIAEVSAETIGMLFEAEGLKDSLIEAEDEMDRLLEILVEGKPRQTRGH